MNKEISIVVPHYNSVSKLLRLLSTIPEDERIEVIVVDDNSNITENQKELLIKHIKEKGILLDNSTGKRGAGVCRNIGIDHAMGKWILFADADDYFMPEAFDTFMENVDDKADIIFFDMTSINETDGSISDRHLGYSRLVNNYLKHDDDLCDLDIRANWSSPTTKMIQKSLIEQLAIRFDESIVANDVMFSLRAGMNAKTIKAVAKTTYCVTKDENTLTTIRNHDRTCVRFKKYWEKYNYLDKRIGRTRLNTLGMGIFQFLLYALRSKYLLMGIKIVHDNQTNTCASINWFGWLKNHYRVRRI